MNAFKRVKQRFQSGCLLNNLSIIFFFISLLFCFIYPTFVFTIVLGVQVAFGHVTAEMIPFAIAVLKAWTVGIIIMFFALLYDSYYCEKRGIGIEKRVK